MRNMSRPEQTAGDVSMQSVISHIMGLFLLRSLRHCAPMSWPSEVHPDKSLFVGAMHSCVSEPEPDLAVICASSGRCRRQF